MDLADIPFDLFTLTLQRISELAPISKKDRARQAIKTSSPPTHRSRILDLLAPFFQLHTSNPAERTPLRTTLVHLLLPHLDAERRYDLKERRLATKLALELGLKASVLESWDHEAAWGGQYAEREIPVCLGEVVGREWDKKRDLRSNSTQLTVLEVDALLTELAAHSSWSSSYVHREYPHPRPLSTLLKLLYPHTLSSFQASFITQLILRDITPLLSPPPTARRTVSLREYDAKSRYLLEMTDVLGLTSPQAGEVWKSRADVRRVMEGLQALEEGDGRPGMEVGTNVQIPKCQKTTSLQGTLKAYVASGETKLWAETKYDGERMQIHINLGRPLGQQITIFSKSKRDSTRDRLSTHSTIREAFHLPVDLSLRSCPSLVRRALAADRPPCAIRRSVIVEAEMVPFNERKGKIEEFWKITQCPGDSRATWRRSGKRQSTDARNLERLASQNSQVANRDDLHLQLVFFDLLELDGQSHLESTYEERRATLEQVVRVIPGWTMLAARTPVRLDRGLGTATKELEAAFTDSVRRFEEGLVLKPANASHDRHQWQKMKRDYIPGLGDTVDLVLLGASWDAQRGRELNVAPTVLTTFHVGVKLNCSISQPRFLILFKASYGLDRDALDHWNAWLADDRCTPWTAGVSGASTLSHAVEVPAGVSPPTVLLKRPLLIELYGASFQKIASCPEYELRWPRVQKIYPPREKNGGKSWLEALSASAYRETALQALGRATSDALSPVRQRGVREEGQNPDSLDIEALFPPSLSENQMTMVPHPLLKRLSTANTSSSVSSFYLDLSEVSKRTSGGLFKRSRSADENEWSPANTTQNTSSDEESSWSHPIHHALQPINIVPCPTRSSSSSSPIKARRPIASSIQVDVLPALCSDEVTIEVNVFKVTTFATENASAKDWPVDDSAVCVSNEHVLDTPSRPLRHAALHRVALCSSGDRRTRSAASPAKRQRISTKSVSLPDLTLRRVLESSTIYLPPQHDVPLTPPSDVFAECFGTPTRRKTLSQEERQHATPTRLLRALGLAHAPSFDDLLARPDQDALLLLDPSSPRFRRDVQVFRSAVQARTGRPAKVRVLDVWCLREKKSGLEDAWQRFCLGEI